MPEVLLPDGITPAVIPEDTVWTTHGESPLYMTDIQKTEFLRLRTGYVGEATACLELGINLSILRNTCKFDPAFGAAVATHANRATSDCEALLMSVVNDKEVPAADRFNSALKVHELVDNSRHRKRLLTLKEKQIAAQLVAIQNTVSVTVNSDRLVEANPAGMTKTEMETYTRLYKRVRDGDELTDAESMSYVRLQQRMMRAMKEGATSSAVAKGQDSGDVESFADPGPDESVEQLYLKSKKLAGSSAAELPHHGVNGNGNGVAKQKPHE